MKPALAEIIPGLQTPIWGYNGIYPGPTVHSTVSRPTVLRQINSLPGTAAPHGRDGRQGTGCAIPPLAQTRACSANPALEFDLPLIVGDIMLKPDGSILLDDHDESGMFGDVILVNGRPGPAMPVKRRKYRFRMLNASVTRSYGMFLESGDPFTLIATDGGLMPQTGADAIRPSWRCGAVRGRHRFQQVPRRAAHSCSPTAAPRTRSTT